MLLCDGFVLWHQCLHEHPSDEVGYGAVAEDNHVASGFARDTKELEGLALSFSVGEKEAAAPVDGEGAESAKHGADACDGCDG